MSFIGMTSILAVINYFQKPLQKHFLNLGCPHTLHWGNIADNVFAAKIVFFILPLGSFKERAKRAKPWQLKIIKFSLLVNNIKKETQREPIYIFQMDTCGWKPKRGIKLRKEFSCCRYVAAFTAQVITHVSNSFLPFESWRNSFRPIFETL